MKSAKAFGLWTAAAATLGTFVTLFFIYLLAVRDSPHEPYQGAAATSSACRPCHQPIYDSYVKTGHYLTSQAATGEAVLGEFDAGRNVIATPVPELVFEVERKRDGFFQTAVFKGEPAATFSRPVDVVVGSGERSQTFIFWEGERLFQLPGMYFTPGNFWTLGPGYENWIAAWGDLPEKDLEMLYQRPIGGRCIECHASTVTPTRYPVGFHFQPQTLELGISCEKCHGPGSRHIAHHEQNPGLDEGHEIVNPADLSRSRQLSSCALCHAGQGVPRTPPLSFRPGDEIAAHRIHRREELKQLSVHGGQVPFLQESPCFLQSGTMTCSTCHNVHVDETDQTKMFSAKCLDCHQQSHADNAELAQSDRCTACHMPDQQAGNLPVYHEGEELFLSMANHRIGIFQGLTD